MTSGAWLTGLLPLRLLAERAGLTSGVSTAMRRRGFHPGYDRGQVLVDLALTLIGGGPHRPEPDPNVTTTTKGTRPEHGPGAPTRTPAHSPVHRTAPMIE